MISLDAFDLKILRALQDDGRLTNQELAEIAGLSASQCSRRRMRLEEEKVIPGYRAELDSEALGFGVIAFIQITLATHSPDNAKKFRALVNRIDDIQEAYSLTGDSDYVLKAVLRDLKSLSDIVNDVLMPHQSVAHVRSSIVLDRLKEGGRLPCGGDARRWRKSREIRHSKSAGDLRSSSRTRIAGANHGAAAATELRILRQGPAAECARCAHLLLRMHLLRRLRRNKTLQRLPQLRRRLCAATDQPIEAMAAGRLRRESTAIGKARVPEIRARRDRRTCGADQRRSAGGQVTRGRHSAGRIVPSTSPKPTR